MPAQPDPIPPGPDDIDRGLREIIAGHGSESAVREPSAAERARQAKRQAPRTTHGWGHARKARKLRRPVPEPGRRSGRFKLGRQGGAAGRRQAAARRQGVRWRRLRVAAIRIGVLIAFAGLLYGLHLLGFGPH
jgi:hypothetical protein